jgi:hypothetical protein
VIHFPMAKSFWTVMEINILLQIMLTEGIPGNFYHLNFESFLGSGD